MIYYQGIPGSFSWLAAKKRFNENQEYIGLESFEDVFDRVTTEKNNFGIIPIENSLAGSVIQIYDLLYQNQVWLTGELYLPIHHCLLALPETKLDKIEKVYSHEVALKQCKDFFLANPNFSQKSFSNTATAAKHIYQKQNLRLASISSKEAAEIYNLKVLQENIEDDPNNWTRFVVVKSRQNLDPHFLDVSKASLAYKLKRDTPGSLYNSLEPLVSNGINLVNIESRPIPGKFFEYIFYIDMEFEENSGKKIQKAFAELKNLTEELKILGVYRKSK